MFSETNTETEDLNGDLQIERETCTTSATASSAKKGIRDWPFHL